MMNTEAMNFKLVPGREDPSTRKQRLRKRVSENDACYQGVRERLVCDNELCTGGVVVCDCVCVCMSSVCVRVCVHVST